MEIKLILRKDMKQRYSLTERIGKRLHWIKRIYKNKKAKLFVDFLTGGIPEWDVLGLFTPKTEIVVDIESTYKYHSVSELTFINKFGKIVGHEIIHSEIYPINKHRTTQQEHWAIRRMGF